MELSSGSSSGYSMPFRQPCSVYHMLHSSRLKICGLGGVEADAQITLPPNYKVVAPLDFTYNFEAELQFISQLHDEQSAEAARRKLEDERRQEEAWRRLEQERLERTRRAAQRPSDAAGGTSNPNVLVDLSFDAPAHSRRLQLSGSQERLHKFRTQFLQSTANRELFARLVDMGLNVELVWVALELVGTDNSEKLVNFVTEFQRLEELPDKFPRERIQQAMLMFDADYSSVLTYLRTAASLAAKGFTDSQVVEALSWNNNDINLAAKYLQAFASVKELGFADNDKIKEALILANLDSQKAVQDLLERS
eukprot:TRINITY_DN18498_c0_g1_i1.p1 TRINITY_DN18498_c0_g1~~TRINITY_DN18498_c0_g1_i1.p1  ORF type:complete len:319 (-),score=96.72 TRINITY_DN18498_c0_g1_i1:98-1021(-)